MNGAIFDMDGTLIDSMSVWTYATTLFYKRRNLKLSDEEFEYFRSIMLSESLPYIKKTYNLPETVEEISDEFEDIILKEYKYNIPIKPYADVFLKQLKADGVKLAVATSSKPRYCRAVFERLKIFDLFDAFAYSDEVGVNKSKPDVYLLAADRLGKCPSECTVFEDISVGILSAKSAGFKTCAIYDDSNKDETQKLRESSDRYILSWQELIKKG